MKYNNLSVFIVYSWNVLDLEKNKSTIYDR